jgi:hypothetical protein
LLTFYLLVELTLVWVRKSREAAGGVGLDAVEDKNNRARNNGYKEWHCVEEYFNLGHVLFETCKLDFNEVVNTQ